MKRLVLALCGLILVGCEKPVEEMGYAEQSKLAAEIVQRCAALGLKPGSQQMASCTEVEARKEVYSRRANKERRSTALTVVGQGMAGYADGYAKSSRMNQPVRLQANCTSQAMGGGTVSTNCY